MADQATSIAVSFATSSFVAQIVDSNISGFQRGKVDTTHSGTTPVSGTSTLLRTYIPSNVCDGGDLNLTIHLNPAATPPLYAAAEVVTVTFPIAAGQSVGTTWVFTGFVTSYNQTMNPLADETMRATITVAIASEIVITAGS